MKNLINNFKASLKHNHQKILILILAFLAGVELLGLIYAFNIIRLSQKEKLSLEQSQSWDYYTLASYLSKDPLYDDETKVIESFGKYLILDPQLKIANQVLSIENLGNNSNDRSNICPTSTIDEEQVKNFQTLILASDIAYIKRGKIRFQLGDYQGSINDFNRAIDLNNKNKSTLSKSIASAYFELANSKPKNPYHFFNELSSKGSNPNILLSNINDNSNSAIKFNPNFANAYYLRGYLSYYKIPSHFSVAYGKRNSKEAINKAIEKGIFNENIFFSMIDDFKNAIRNDPFFYKKYPYVLNAINPCPVFSDEYSSLIKNLTEKIKTNPNDGSLYHQRALIYLDSNNNQKAIEDLNQVIQLNSSDNSLKALAYYGLWLAHYKQKNYQEALENINKVIKIYPDFPDLYAIRGLTYYDFSKLSKNTKDLDKVIEDSNHAIKLHEELLKKYNPQEDSRFLDEQPHANAYFIRGLAYYDLGNQTQALSDYLKALPEWSGSMWPALINGPEGGGVREIPFPPGFPP
ncbi:tetratricopeptide repeat protein [Planktothrix mougeotii]|uniref:Tetratricopeptide repeat protein n=1 Tax=Planktothrix mougeotii LEGE 06226 TaxID=1828728 RepID=A0ABR9U7J9_9CYAN|nr:tetratricopeptide repeat protein [Planktothrix mougeotii]MBE9141796.1 tetratricopeptide repeat protein [Planktothrix mougeotii LEGE 06226]